MAITLEELRHLGELARLKLSDTELMAMHADLNKVLEHFESLQEIDFAGIPLTSHSVESSNVWAEDEPEEGLERDEALASAPQADCGLFLVPTIIE
ncbi:MAG TPA: Asp-tRNA(Asn)/Glu-tRNA(Gln) amidotransferase subunit GatC [Fimbriimonadales bacterium]|nr:Asp-tRNA(Asn)/Glu-tRNA(Gln) amidotransferase subunit GatC [Fimbriimonadales bacterium]